MKGTELIVIEKVKPEVLFTKEGELEKVMEMIRQKVNEFEPDLETVSGRKEIASMARKVSSSKTFLDDIRKTQNAKAQAEIKGRNSLWNPARDELDGLRDKTRKPLTDWEAKEKRKDEQRIASVREKIDHLKEFRVYDPRLITVIEIEQCIIAVEDWKIEPEEYFEFTTEANELKTEILIQNSKMLELRVQLDKEEAERKAEDERLSAERAELEKSKAEQAEKDRIEREKREAEQAKLKAEQDRIAAEQKAAQDKIDEENRKIKEEKERLEREEFERQAKIQAEKDAEENRRIAEQKAAEAKEREDAERERQEALKPDKEKLHYFSQFLVQGIAFPEVKSEEAAEILKDASKTIAVLSVRVYEAAEAM